MNPTAFSDWPLEFATPELLLAAIDAACGRGSGGVEAVKHVLWLNERNRQERLALDAATAQRLVDSLNK